MLKKAIRNRYLKNRNELADEERDDYSARIVRNFETLDTSQVNFLLSYSPLSDRKEFNISLCAQSVKDKGPKVNIGWPRIEPDLETMEAYLIEPDGLYAKNKYNILEPINGAWMAPELFDMVFVPMLAFDVKGYRVGYGKGYYDRYLIRCRPGILKIGFSFFDPVARIKDINDFDVPLNLCITPSRIYEF